MKLHGTMTVDRGGVYCQACGDDRDRDGAACFCEHPKWRWLDDVNEIDLEVFGIAVVEWGDGASSVHVEDLRAEVDGQSFPLTEEEQRRAEDALIDQYEDGE